MAKRKARKKTAKSKSRVAAKKRIVKPPSPAQYAARINWQLKGDLKNVQVAYIRACKLLARVRDEKLYAELKYASMEDYARGSLSLGRASLYRYLQIYDWLKVFHTPWLDPKPKGFIPDFSDISDLMWIEKELERKDLGDEDRKELEALQKKGLAGELRQKDVREWRHRDDQAETISDYLDNFNDFRARCAKMAGLPQEALACLDDAIAILKNHRTVARCGFDMSDLSNISAVV